jgi:PPIC-type PPIASE domain
VRPVDEAPGRIGFLRAPVRHFVYFRVLDCMKQSRTSRSPGSGLLREPLLHFFVLGALLFGVDHLRTEPTRLIRVTPGLRADLERRFLDDKGHPPNPEEKQQAFRSWQRDEVLFREALARNLDKSDPNIRRLLIDKMPGHLATEIQFREPSEALLTSFYEAHADLYQEPLRYDFQFLAFSRSRAGEEELAQAQAAIALGKKPSELGRPLSSADLTVDDMKGRLSTRLIEEIVRAPLGSWVRVDGESDIWLLWVTKTSGGLPRFQDVRDRVMGDWQRDQHKRDIDAAIDRIVNDYQFQEASDGG